MINASFVALSEVIKKLEQIKMVLLEAVANRGTPIFLLACAIYRISMISTLGLAFLSNVNSLSLRGVLVSNVLIFTV